MCLWRGGEYIGHICMTSEGFWNSILNANDWPTLFVGLRRHYHQAKDGKNYVQWATINIGQMVHVTHYFWPIFSADVFA